MSSFRRRSYRRYVARPKRNAERVIRGGSSTVAPGTQQIAYTWTAKESCSIKSIRLDLGASASNANIVPYVLVRVPEGYNANTIVYPAIADDMYNPTDMVLISGILTDPTVEDHKSNWIGRKMKPGDRLALIIFNGAVAGNIDISFELSFTVLT